MVFPSLIFVVFYSLRMRIGDVNIRQHNLKLEECRASSMIVGTWYDLKFSPYHRCKSPLFLFQGHLAAYVPELNHICFMSHVRLWHMTLNQLFISFRCDHYAWGKVNKALTHSLWRCLRATAGCSISNTATPTRSTRTGSRSAWPPPTAWPPPQTGH